MERASGRRFTPEEKLKILEEGRQPGTTVSEVCRRHQIAATQFYDWERRARQGALAGLAAKVPGRPARTQEAALATEVATLRTVVVALTTENVKLRGGATGPGVARASG